MQKPDRTYDIPIERDSQDTPENERRLAARLVAEHCGQLNMKPRLILRHTASDASDPKLIELYIYPLHSEETFRSESTRYFTFDEIRSDTASFSPTLLRELTALEMAAQLWQQYFKDNDTTRQSR